MKEQIGLFFFHKLNNGGLKEGINSNKIEIAKNMLKKNISIADIIEIIGLTKEEVEKLK